MKLTVSVKSDSGFEMRFEWQDETAMALHEVCDNGIEKLVVSRVWDRELYEKHKIRAEDTPA